MKATTVCITSTKAENYFLYIRSRQGFHLEIFVRKAFKINVWIFVLVIGLFGFHCYLFVKFYLFSLYSVIP